MKIMALIDHNTPIRFFCEYQTSHFSNFLLIHSDYLRLPLSIHCEGSFVVKFWQRAG
jgi:hypothetical protein